MSYHQNLMHDRSPAELAAYDRITRLVEFAASNTPVGIDRFDVAWFVIRSGPHGDPQSDQYQEPISCLKTRQLVAFFSDELCQRAREKGIQI